MPLKPIKLSDDNIIKALENAGIVVEKNTNISNGKIPIVFEDGTESYLDKDFIIFDSQPYFDEKCEAVYYTNASETVEYNNNCNCTSYNPQYKYYESINNHINFTNELKIKDAA